MNITLSSGQGFSYSLGRVWDSGVSRNQALLGKQGGGGDGGGGSEGNEEWPGKDIGK